MDLNSTKASPVISDSSPIKISRMGIHSSISPCSQSGPSFSTNMLTRKLNAAKSSSTPCKKNVKDSSFEISSDDSEATYVKWMIKYPSALKSFQHIVNQARNRKIVMALDYDGTLSPIVDDPDRAFMSDNMRSAVKNVAKYFPTAIISGRSRDKVSELVGLDDLYYAGSHGMDIKIPAKEIVSTDNSKCIISTNKQGQELNVFQPAREFAPMICEVFRTLVERTRDITGTKVENHKFCASVHYRNVDEKSWSILSQLVHDVLNNYPLLRLTHGRKVLEIRPAIDWDKGRALEFLLESLGLSNTRDVLPIYIGDDRTDEDAFKVLQEGNRGYGILVSTVPKESKALFSLKNPSEVKLFLESLVRMKEENEL